MRLLHATDEASAKAILLGGFRLDALHKSDPGDLGLGVYFTSSLDRAKAIGRAILEVWLEPVSPLHLRQEDAYLLVIDSLGFDTIHGHGLGPDRRAEEARKARDWFLSQGHDALVTYRPDGDLEVVVYDPTSIGEARRIK